MSWFKNNDDGELPMSNAPFAMRPPKPAAGDTRVTDFDLSLPAAPAPPRRIEPKAALEPKPVPVPAPEVKPMTSVFGASLRFKGELRADEDFVLQGQIEGSIHHTQNLTIGTDGVVKGDSRAHTIVVEGTVDGDLYALESISIRPTAKVRGNLLAPRVAIADGASFNGKVDMATATKAARSIAERQLPATIEERKVDQVLSAGA
jgi:cytoskeletal protein CcmA (bactofilin family)